MHPRLTGRNLGVNPALISQFRDHRKTAALYGDRNRSANTTFLLNGAGSREPGRHAETSVTERGQSRDADWRRATKVLRVVGKALRFPR